MKDDFDVPNATERLMEAERFVAYKDTRELLMWKGGAYRSNAEADVRAKIEAAYPETTNHEKNEVVEKLIDRVMIDRHAAEVKAWPFLSLSNGVIDIRSGEFYHDFDVFEKTNPGIILTNPLTHLNYDPKARCPTFWRFIVRGFPEVDDQTLLWDHFASTLDRRCIKRRAFLIWGEPDTSKTTFLNIENRLLGDSNIKHISLDFLCGREDRFALASMRNVMLNSFADLDPKITLGYLGNFKALTGGDPMTVRAIYSQFFDMWPFVKLHFSAQLAPPLQDITDEGFWGRFDIIHARNVLEKKDPDFATKLSDSELSGILNELLKRFRLQYSRPGFKIVRPASEVKDIWLGMAEPGRIFVKEIFFPDPNHRVETKEVYPLWEKWRHSRKPAPGPISHTQLNTYLRQALGLNEKPSKSNGRQFWLGIGYRGQDGQIELPKTETKVTDSSISPSDKRKRKRNRSEIPSLSSLEQEWGIRP